MAMTFICKSKHDCYGDDKNNKNKNNNNNSNNNNNNDVRLKY